MLINVFKSKLAILVCGLLICLAGVAASAQESASSPNVSPLPAPTGMVNDFAGVIDEATKQQIETRLRTFKEKLNPPVEIAVVTVKSTAERDIFDYSLAVARGWGIGSKEDDNPSALLFVAVDDRKYFTQVSRDLEDELPDGLVGQLQRQHLVPEFKKGNYGKGIADTVEAYIRAIEQRNSGGLATPTPAATGGRGRTSQSAFSAFCCFAVILVLALIIFSNRGGRGGRRGGGWGGGGFGGGGGALPWIIGSIIANAGSSSGSSSGSWGGSGDWGGGGGGSDWGGFGGGGDFGGGGAGGDW
ncbi:MAG TPA: TPM domain-containing protein [Pyrinomonadaceae bacterium]|nr:TPM domain-containing protein [Pyrinomonadaceae bacterium]